MFSKINGNVFHQQHQSKSFDSHFQILSVIYTIFPLYDRTVITDLFHIRCKTNIHSFHDDEVRDSLEAPQHVDDGLHNN